MRVRVPWLSFALIACPAVSQAAAKIPPPTGPFPIGRVGYHWVDRSRPEPHIPDPAARRELMVYFWYPAAKSHAAAAVYLPGAPQFDRNPEARERMHRSFGDNWPAILSGDLHGHAVDHAAVAETGQPFPLIIFSHGAGGTGFNYTALIEDVVSHGYVVAAIEHTFAAKAVWFPGGRVVQASDDTAPAGLSAEERAKWRGARITEGIEEGAADVRFVFDRILALNHDPAHFMLAGRVDPARTAPMGHSAGAEFAARACQIESRFRACVDLDGGMVPVAALPLAPDGATMKTPLLFLEAYHPEATMGGLPHDVIAQYYKKREEQLRECPKGSYAVVLQSPGIAHPSFGDMPPLFAGEHEYPDRTAALHNLDLIRSFVRDFLARSLRGEEAPLLESGGSPVPEATVQGYGR